MLQLNLFKGEPLQISKSYGKFCIAKVKITTENIKWLNSFPGFKKWKGRDLLFDPTGANIQHIKKFCPEAVWDSTASYILDNYLQTLKEAENNLANKKNFQLPHNDDFKFKTKPFDHQRKAFYLSRDKKNFALLMEQGTGKTKVIIDNSAYLYANNKINFLVVIAPNGVHRNWINNELPLHLPDWCPRESFYYTSGMGKKDQAKFESVMYAKNCLKVLSFNVESFISKKAVDYMQKILLANDVMLVVDESSRIKRPSAKRTKIITKFSKYAKYKRIMTGTPVTKGAEDVYSQFKFLDPNILGYDSFYSFKARYCVMGGYESKQIVSYQNINELTQSIQGHSFRILKKDCLDLPDKIYQRYPIQLTTKQKQIYNSLKKEFITELQGETLSAPETITRILRLQQITCNWFATENGTVEIEKENPRITALKDILSQIQSKVIIWARFKADIRAIEKLLGNKAVSYYGDINNNDREENIRLFQNDPKIKYFIGQPQSGGIGLNLTAAEYAIYYSNSFDLEIRLQSEDRCHRIGTKSNVTYIDIETVKTIDSKIIKALRSKKHLANIINEDPVSLFLEKNDE